MSELTIIRVPRADPNLPPLVLDLAEIYMAQGRGEEVKFVTTHKAPELLALFNKAYLDASRIINALEYELVLANEALDSIKSVILLDQMKDILISKGLANARNPLGSEDIRQAVYNQNPDCKRARMVVENLAAYIKRLTDIRKYFQNSYDSVKKIMGSEPGAMHTRQNPNLVASLSGSNSQTTNNQALSEPPDDDFFGTAR